MILQSWVVFKIKKDKVILDQDHPKKKTIFKIKITPTSDYKKYFIDNGFIVSQWRFKKFKLAMEVYKLFWVRVEYI